MKSTHATRIIFVAVFAVLCGLDEIVVGRTGNFLGILTRSILPSPATAIVGLFYTLGGLFLLTMRKWGAALAMMFICAEVLGRAYLVWVGIAPSGGADLAKVAVGGAIALALVGYIATQWNHFR